MNKSSGYLVAAVILMIFTFILGSTTKSFISIVLGFGCLICLLLSQNERRKENQDGSGYSTTSSREIEDLQKKIAADMAQKNKKK